MNKLIEIMETNRKFLTFTVLILAFLSIWSAISFLNEFYLGQYSVKAKEEQHLDGSGRSVFQDIRYIPNHHIKVDFIQGPDLNQIELNDLKLRDILLLHIGDLENLLKKSYVDKDNTGPKGIIEI